MQLLRFVSSIRTTMRLLSRHKQVVVPQLHDSMWTVNGTMYEHRFSDRTAQAQARRGRRLMRTRSLDARGSGRCRESAP